MNFIKQITALMFIVIVVLTFKLAVMYNQLSELEQRLVVVEVQQSAPK